MLSGIMENLRWRLHTCQKQKQIVCAWGGGGNVLAILCILFTCSYIISLDIISSCPKQAFSCYLIDNFTLYFCSKTPQNPTLSKRQFPKTPVGTTPNQRRKTWCYTEPNNKSKSIRTPCRSGILKHGNLTDKQTKKSCSFILRNKEDLATENAGVTSSDNFMSHTCSGITGTSVVQEEKTLIHSLEKCYEMFKEVILLNIYFRNVFKVITCSILYT